MLRLTSTLIAAMALAACASTPPPGEPIAADVTATRFETLEGTTETTATAVEQPLVISGTIVYRERMLLPGVTRAEIEVVNSATGETIAETTIENAGQIPIPFAITLPTDRAERVEAAGLNVRLLADGRMYFATEKPVPVIEAGNAVWPGEDGRAEIVLRRNRGE